MGKRARVCVAVVVCLAWAHPAASQIPVIDVAQVARLVQIVRRVQQIVAEVAEQKRLLAVMNERLPSDRMEAYRTPAIAGSSHDLEAAKYARAILAALSAGDARGDLFRQVVKALPPLNEQKIPAGARGPVRGGYAAVEVSDAVLMRAINQIGAVRGYSAGALAAAIDAVQDDALAARTAYHRPTARLDVLAGAAMVEARQQQAENQLASHQLEAAIVQAMQRRATEADAASQRIQQYTHRPTPTHAGAAVAAFRIR